MFAHIILLELTHLKINGKKSKKSFYKKKHLAFFDMAYQGFTSGDTELDAYSLRLFAENDDIPIMLA